MDNKKNKVVQIFLWIIQGFVVGIGAILPGVSGGTLCYAFGMYDPILEVLSSPFKAIKKHWFKLCFFALGGAIGFVGFSGVIAWLLSLNESVVLCVFVGLIMGTLPEIWHDAGKRGRSKASIFAMALSFIAISAIFYLLKNTWQITIEPNFVGFLLCGFLWGLSFIIPGFSSSTLLLFFGIYEKMSEGISRLDLSVILPLGIAMLATLLLCSRLMSFLFSKFHSIMSHCVLGFVVATTVMILPSFDTSFVNIVIYLLSVVGGAVASFFFTKACAKIKEN